MNNASDSEEITLDDGTQDLGDFTLEDALDPSPNTYYQTGHGIGHKIGYAIGWTIANIVFAPLRLIGLFRKTK